MASQTPLSDTSLARLRTDLVGLARHLGLSRDTAEDAAQTALAQMLGQVAAGQDIATPRAYAKTILRRTCARHRQQNTAKTLPEDLSATTGSESDLHVLAIEVCAALVQLPEDQRRLLLRVAEGQTSPAALAEEFDLPVGTIMSRLARGRARLKQTLDLPAGKPVL